MPPLEGHGRRARVDLHDLPGEGGHHALEDLVAGVEVVAHGAVVLVGLDDGVVGAHLEHVLARLRRAAVDAERVLGPVDRAPVGQIGLERGLDLPVLDELLDQVGERLCFVVHFLGCGGERCVSI